MDEVNHNIFWQIHLSTYYISFKIYDYTTLTKQWKGQFRINRVTALWSFYDIC